MAIPVKLEVNKVATVQDMICYLSLKNFKESGKNGRN